MTTTANGMTVPSIETSNVLQHLESPEYVLQVGEGLLTTRLTILVTLHC